MTVEQLLGSVGSRELTEWMVFLDPKGVTVEDSLRQVFGKPNG